MIKPSGKETEAEERRRLFILEKERKGEKRREKEERTWFGFVLFCSLFFPKKRGKKRENIVSTRSYG